MADFSAFKITNVGIALENRIQTGTPLNFTKFIIGDGIFTGNVKNLIALINPIMEVPITRLSSQSGNNSKVTIGFDLSSQDVSVGFYLREIGIYAEDPDGGNDILVFYGNAGDTADYIEPSTSATMTEKMIDIEMYIDSASTITAVIDSSLVYATQDDVADLQTQINGKAPTAHTSTNSIYGIGSSNYYGHTKIINTLTQSINNPGESLSAYQGYVLNQKFTNYLPLTGGNLTGDVNLNSNQLKFSSSGLIEFREIGYGDKFRIAPYFGGADDSNILQIQGTVGAAGTDPTDWKTLLQITAKSGNISTPGYISASNGFRGALTGNVTGNVTGNLTGKTNGYEWDINTANTSGTWLLVTNGDKIQHRAINTIFNYGTSVPSSLANGQVYFQYFD